MAIVQAGKQFTNLELKRTAGDVADRLVTAVQDGTNFGTQLGTMTDADLIVQFGFTQDECNAIKGFYIGDLPAIRDLVAASLWIKQLLGTGV